MTELVAGVDSSTQSCKVVVRDARTGALLRHGRAAHPDGTEVHPDAWWAALRSADRRGGRTRRRATRWPSARSSTGWSASTRPGRSCGRRCCGTTPGPRGRPPTWSTSSVAGEAGRRAWADAVGTVPVASFTVTKLRWLAEHEPDAAERTAAVCAAARLADLAAAGDRRRSGSRNAASPTAATRAAPATGPPPTTPTGPTCSSARSATTPCVPARARAVRARRQDLRRRRARARHRRQRGGGPGPRSTAGRRRGLDRHLRASRAP